MGYIKVGEENSDEITLYYEDHGASAPVVLIHDFPLSSHSWEKQLPALLNAGFRVISYDRRGFGASSQPASGYDYDAFTRDLHTLMTALDVRDAVLVGCSMGAGEVVRYLGTYGSGRVSKVALLAPLPPFLLRTPDNPEGVHARVFDDIMAAILMDRPAYLKVYLSDCYNLGVLGGVSVSEQVLWLGWSVAVRAPAKATVDCVAAWATDFRRDLPTIDVPVLVLQGNQDRVFPIQATGQRLPALIKDAQLMVIEGGPHAINWTHAEELNCALLDFLGR